MGKLKNILKCASDNALIVAIISLLIVAWVQSCEKKFDKKVDIISDFSYLADSMGSNNWNIHDAYKLDNEDAKYSTWQKGQDLSNEYNGLVDKMKFNFSVTDEDAVIKDVRKLHNLLITIRNRIKSIDFSQETEAEKIEVYMNAEDGRATKLTRDIRQELKDYIGEIDEETMRKLLIPNTTSSIRELPPKN